MEIYPNATDADIYKMFSELKKGDVSKASLLFREVFTNRDLTFSPNVTAGFADISKAALSELLNKSVRSRNVEKILSGELTEEKFYKSYELETPYLLRITSKPEYQGMVRFSELINKSGDIHTYEILDFIPFKSNLITLDKSLLCKADDELMEMFSVVYRSAEAWQEVDGEGDFMQEEEIRKAIEWANVRGIGLNIEHDLDQTITHDQAEVIESYQARSNWKEGELEVRKGDWVAKTKFYNNDLWEFTKENIETYSFEGAGIRELNQSLPKAA